eukprot:678982-Prymnesium_polylepis.2
MRVCHQRMQIDGQKPVCLLEYVQANGVQVPVEGRTQRNQVSGSCSEWVIWRVATTWVKFIANFSLVTTPTNSQNAPTWRIHRRNGSTSHAHTLDLDTSTCFNAPPKTRAVPTVAMTATKPGPACGQSSQRASW